MACLSSSRRAQLNARLTQKNTQLTAANALYEQLLADPTASYRFDSGEGMQQTASKKLAEVSKQISKLETEVDRIQRQLGGGGIVNLNMRRG